MKVCDVNLLVYAYDSSSAKHAEAKSWLRSTLSGSETFGFTWVVLLAFVRLTTNPRVFDAPLDVVEALDIVGGWLAQPCATVVEPTDQHIARLKDLLPALGAAGNLTTDAHLAAIAIEHGAELCSCDADFSRFAGLRWTDPLSPQKRVTNS